MQTVERSSIERSEAAPRRRVTRSASAQRQRVSKSVSETQALASIAKQLDVLVDKSARELGVVYEQVYGVPTRSRNRKYLLDQIAWRMQEQAGLFDEVLAKVEHLASLAPEVCRRRIVRESGVPVISAATTVDDEVDPDRDPRLPPVGAVLEREYDGHVHRVRVLPHGFEKDGRQFRTLSEVARAITGTRWNGFLFFEDALTKARADRGGAS